MPTTRFLKRLLGTATKAVQFKAAVLKKERYRELAKAVHLRQWDQVQAKLTKALSGLFDKQVKDAQSRIEKSQEVFDARDYDKSLTSTAAPILAQAYIDAALVQLKLMRVDLDKVRKASTASDYLAGTDRSLPSVVLNTASGDISIDFATEYPAWMKASMKKHLEDAFNEPYWQEINDTTADDIKDYLDKAADDGWSIPETAKAITTHFGLEYTKARATNVARTELGNILNAARSEAIDDVIKHAGSDLPIKKTWLSVLGPTTRKEHADLDGVPANEDGLWNLGGVLCRWPGDIKLPARNRCNCQCTIVASFGMLDADADALIDDYEDRTAEDLEKSWRSKVFCPTGEGGGVDPTCGHSNPGAHAMAVVSSMLSIRSD